MTVRIAFLVNGDYHSAMGYRARYFNEHLKNRYEIAIAYRCKNKLASIFNFFIFLIKNRPGLVYIFDIGYPGIIAGAFYKFIARSKLVIDTGDAIYELIKSTGEGGALKAWLTKTLEQFSFTIADRVVVRGTGHKELLKKSGILSEVVRDGVNTKDFKPLDTSNLRKMLNLENVFTIGMVGSSVWSEKLKMCYGWDLVEVVNILKNKPIRGIMIGDGSGIAKLNAKCRQYGIEDKMIFLGRIAYDALPHYINLIDVCLSTQTNNIVGQVRTTGKLPLYLACGRYILASDVGEASLVLPSHMLVPYKGLIDRDYPNRIAERIRYLLVNPKAFELAQNNPTIAKICFEYKVLAEKLAELFFSANKRAIAPTLQCNKNGGIDE